MTGSSSPAGSVRGVDPAAEEAIAGAAASLARAIEAAVERQWRQWFPDMPPAVADVPAGIRAWHAALGRAGGWPDPPYYAEDMARLLRDAAEQAPFRIQGGPDYCNGLRRAAALVEEFGVAAPAVPEGRWVHHCGPPDLRAICGAPGRYSGTNGWEMVDCPACLEIGPDAATWSPEPAVPEGRADGEECGCGRRCAWCGAGGGKFAPEEDFAADGADFTASVVGEREEKP